MTKLNRSCEACRRVVGTYEPAVFVLGGVVTHSSRAADPELSRWPGCDILHADCYAANPEARAPQGPRAPVCIDLNG